MAAIVGKTDPFYPPSEEMRHRKWVQYAKLAGKIFLVALTVAGFAAACYFSFGFAVVAMPFTWQAVLCTIGGFGSGFACLSAPVLASVFRMYNLSDDNFNNCLYFLRAVFAAAFIAAAAFFYFQGSRASQS